MRIDSAEILLARHATRNFWLNVLDGGAFILGLSIVSRYTVLPLFVERISGERWLQGLIPAINYAGGFLPFCWYDLNNVPNDLTFYHLLCQTAPERLLVRK